MKEIINNNKRKYELSLLNNRWNYSIGEVVIINYEGEISESNSYNEGDRHSLTQFMNMTQMRMETL